MTTSPTVVSIGRRSWGTHPSLRLIRFKVQNIATLVGSRDEDTTVLFIRADAPPVYSLHSEVDGNDNTMRLVGLGHIVYMPAGSHNLMLAFKASAASQTWICSFMHVAIVIICVTPHNTIFESMIIPRAAFLLRSFTSSTPMQARVRSAKDHFRFCSDWDGNIIAEGMYPLIAS
jgi:hypothetical protein